MTPQLINLCCGLALALVSGAIMWFTRSMDRSANRSLPRLLAALLLLGGIALIIPVMIELAKAIAEDPNKDAGGLYMYMYLSCPVMGVMGVVVAYYAVSELLQDLKAPRT